MSPTLKRILLIVALIAVAALIAVGLYYAYKQAVPTPAPTAPPPGAPGALPTAGIRGAPPAVGVVTPLPPSAIIPPAGVVTGAAAPAYYQPPLVEKATSDYSIFTSLNNNGEMRYHNASDGKFYHIAADGSIKALSDQVFYNVQKVTWASAKDKAVLEYPDGAKTVYNFDTKKQVTLPSHWEDFSFSPDSNEIAAKSLGLAPENRWLVTTKDDGTGTQLIEPLGENADRVIMDWSPSRQTVALAQTGQPLGLDRREVLLIGLHGENFKSTVVEGLDFQPAWSPTGKKLLYSVDSSRSDFKPELWVVNSYGDEIGSDRKMLQLNTWANKCSFANDDTLFCAVPRDLPQGAGMSPEIAADISDDLFKIDLKTGLKTNIPLDKDYTIDSISYDTNNNKIFFSDHHQTGIFEVKM